MLIPGNLFFICIFFISGKIGVILQRVEALARGIEVVKANQREVLDLLTLLLKNSAAPQPDLPSITELFQLPMKTLQDAKNLTKLLKVQNNASKMVNSKHSSNKQ